MVSLASKNLHGPRRLNMRILSISFSSSDTRSISVLAEIAAGCQSWLVLQAPVQAGSSVDPRCRQWLGPAFEARNGMRNVGIPCPGSSTYKSWNQVN